MSVSADRITRAFIILVAASFTVLPGFGQYARNRYALILEDEPVASRYTTREQMGTAAADGYRRQLASRQSSVHQELQRRGVPIISSVSEVLNAVFVSATPDRIAELEAIPGVIGVRPMRQMHLTLNKATQLHQQVNIRFVINSGRRARFGPPVLVGNFNLDPKRVLRVTDFRRWITGSWKPVTQVRVRSGLEGVRSLLQKDNRLQGTVALESMKYDVDTNRATPTLRIEAGPQIRVNTIGAKVSQSTLRRLIPIFEEHAVDRDLLVEGARNLRDYFQSDGFFDAQVEFKQQRITNDKATVDFLVNTGKRHKLVAIHIKGNHYFSTDVIRERMYLQKANFAAVPARPLQRKPVAPRPD